MLGKVAESSWKGFGKMSVRFQNGLRGILGTSGEGLGKSWQGFGMVPWNGHEFATELIPPSSVQNDNYAPSTQIDKALNREFPEASYSV